MSILLAAESCNSAPHHVPSLVFEASDSFIAPLSLAPAPAPGREPRRKVKENESEQHSILACFAMETRVNNELTLSRHCGGYAKPFEISM
jgi:hypothetical protein